MLSAFRELGFDINSTAVEILSGIKHPLAKLLLSYRSNQKLSSTYGTNFLKHLDEEDRLHPEFHSLGARSGRFSCSKPSLHNIPAEDMYRKCFIARDGYKIYSADYDQIELKVVAVLSNDTLMLEEYKKAGADLHRLTASQIFDTEEVTQEQRDKIGKGCNFGMIYSISEAGMAKRWGMTRTKTHEILKKFRNTYRSVCKFMALQSDLAISQGFTTTKLGRRRYLPLPPMNSQGFEKLVAEVRREGANNVIQGTAADIIKEAIVNISPKLRGIGAHIVNTVHDELVIEAPDESDIAHLVIPIIYEGMMEAGTKIVSDELEWTISLKVGNSWQK